MKHSLWSATVLMLAALGPVAFAADTAAVARTAELERRLAGPDGQVMVVAHRGCWGNTSENSIDAIETCIAFGVDMVEIDVRAARDGTLVLMHDETVDRVTDGTGAVTALDWEQLRHLQLREHRGGPQAPLTSRRIPTLQEALRAAKDRVLVNIDAKGELHEAIYKEVERIGSLDQVLFKSSAPAAQAVGFTWVGKVAYQPIIRQRNLTKDPVATLAEFDSLRPIGYEIDVVTPDILTTFAPAIRQRCARFWVNSLNSTAALHDSEALSNPEAVWGRMIGAGVDTIQTDEPLALKAWLAHREPPVHRCEPAATRSR